MKYLEHTFRVLLMLSLITISCDSLLDTEPRQSVSREVALTGEDNLRSVLIGAYNSLSDDDLLGGQQVVMAELLGNSSTSPEINFSGSFQTLRQIFEKQIQNTNGQVGAAYTRAYITVNIANTLLANLEQIEDQTVKDTFRGEALFIRGTTFFELVKFQGLPYSAGNVNTNLGIQLPLEPEADYSDIRLISRSTVADTYTQIISDLTEAKALLPATNGDFAGSLAASAMLSRVYLQTADYANAAAEASRVIESGEYSLVTDYANAFNNSSVNTSEDIFAIQVSDQDGANDANLFFGSEDNSGRGEINILQAHLDLYEVGDARLDLFYNDDAGNAATPIRTGKWTDQYGNVNVLRLAEMYLTRAEANFELGIGNYVGPVGTTPESDINIIRNRAELANLLVVDLDDILLERKLELAFEGQLLHDLKRRQLNVGNLSFDSEELVFPVPQREVDINPNI